MLPMLIANNRNRFSPKLRCRNKVTYRPKEKLYLAVGAKSRTVVVEIGRKHTKPKVSKPIQGLTASLSLSNDGFVKLATVKPLLQAKRVGGHQWC